jgi:D-sedoheptulose 7-phosphate isomerase
LSHAAEFFGKVRETAAQIAHAAIDSLATDLAEIRAAGGRLFIIGVGGSAGNAGHAVNDFRKLCDIEAYAVTDNVSELTARANDEGWETIFSGWLRTSKLCNKDALLVLSVGGGDEKRNISVNIVEAIKLAKSVGAKTFGIVGRPDGYTALNGENVINVPAVDPQLVTPISESFQALVWHCLVSHPALQTHRTKW